MPVDAKTASLSAAGLILVSVMATAGIISIIPRGEVLEICGDECQIFSEVEYRSLKNHLGEKLRTQEPMTWQEYQALVTLLNREAKRNDGIVILDTKGGLSGGLANYLER